jgi:hypothetical protein
MLLDFSSTALREIAVSISGGWETTAIRDWRGEARASEPIVAVSFCVRESEISWCKSERPHPVAQPVRLLLGPYDSSGCDVQVNFSVGGGHVLSRTNVSSRTYRPLVPVAINASTASVSRFSIIEGSHRVELFVLFLVGADVKLGRNGLWHLRPDLVPSVPEAYRALLSRGRTGELTAA